MQTRQFTLIGFEASNRLARWIRIRGCRDLVWIVVVRDDEGWIAPAQFAAAVDDFGNLVPLHRLF